MTVARTVKAAGASMLRGGAFKPRTSPFAFKGLGPAGLEILVEAKAETGLPIVTELLDSQHADVIHEHADVVQIGARNMQNYALLEVAGKLGLPVLLERGLSSSLEELLMAADYVLKEGNERVMLCERGIRTFETATRFTLDLSAVPWLKADACSRLPSWPRSRRPTPTRSPTSTSTSATRSARSCGSASRRARRRSTPRPSTRGTSASCSPSTTCSGCRSTTSTAAPAPAR